MPPSFACSWAAHSLNVDGGAKDRAATEILRRSALAVVVHGVSLSRDFRGRGLAKPSSSVLERLEPGGTADVAPSGVFNSGTTAAGAATDEAAAADEGEDDDFDAEPVVEMDGRLSVTWGENDGDTSGAVEGGLVGVISGAGGRSGHGVGASVPLAVLAESPFNSGLVGEGMEWGCTEGVDGLQLSGDGTDAS